MSVQVGGGGQGLLSFYQTSAAIGRVYSFGDWLLGWSVGAGSGSEALSPPPISPPSSRGGSSSSGGRPPYVVSRIRAAVMATATRSRTSTSSAVRMLIASALRDQTIVSSRWRSSGVTALS